jgi:hypothetical protein
MNSVTITDLNKKFALPGSYNELTRRQLLNIVGFLYVDWPDWKKKQHILFELLGKNQAAYLVRNLEYKEKLIDLFPLTDFIFSESKLTKNLIPSFTLPSGKKYYGPQDYLRNISFIEFIRCEEAFGKFKKTGDVKFLDRMVAVLYRPKKEEYDPEKDKTGDIREEYNDYILDRRAAIAGQVHLHVRLAVLHFYHGCRNFIVNHKNHRNVFVKDEEKKSSGDSFWDPILIRIAGDVTKIDQVANLRAWTVLRDLDVKIADSKEMQKAIDTPKK